MLQVIYIIVGLIAVLAVSAFVLCQCFAWSIELIDRWREPCWRAYAARKYNELALAFNENKKMEYIFKRMSDDCISGWSFNTWDFRDEVNRKFPNES